MTKPVHPWLGYLGEQKIYDCFLFFNELDLLELRLKTLWSYVHRFVLAECTFTTSGDQKPLYFQENRERFAPYMEKIIHVITPPPNDKDFHVGMFGRRSSEPYQRRAFLSGLAAAGESDVILVSDLDEIPNPSCLPRVKGALMAGAPWVTLRQHWHLLFLNARVVESFNREAVDDPCQWFGTMACKRSTLRKVFGDEPNLLWGTKWGAGGRNVPKIENGGWHFSYIGGIQKVMEKLKATSLREMSAQDAQELKNKIMLGARFEFMEIDSTFPKALRDNLKAYSAYLSNSSEFEEIIRPFTEAWSGNAASQPQ